MSRAKKCHFTIVSMNWNGRIYILALVSIIILIVMILKKKNIVCKYHFLIIFRCKSPWTRRLGSLLCRLCQWSYQCSRWLSSTPQQPSLAHCQPSRGWMSALGKFVITCHKKHVKFKDTRQSVQLKNFRGVQFSWISAL